MLVIAHQIDGAHIPHGSAFSKQRYHAGAVGAPIDVIAKMHQQGLCYRPLRQIVGNQRMHRGQPIQAAMHVADGIDALVGGQGGGCGDEIDHGRTT